MRESEFRALVDDTESDGTRAPTLAEFGAALASLPLAPTNLRLGTPPPAPGLHGYFDMLRARPDMHHAYSLRDQNQLLQYRAGTGKAAAVNYVYQTGDPDPRRQDAAKVVIPAGVSSLQNQVKLPVGTTDGHAEFVTWDGWFGSEFSFARTGTVLNFKTFQFDSPRIVGGVPAIWFEINNRWSLAKDDAGLLTARYYGTSTTPAGPGITKWDPLGPQLANFVIKSETWTRYWVLLEQNTRGDGYTRASLWAADITRDPVLILDRLPITVLGGVQKFWLEFNTSTDPGPNWDRVAYVRNVVMLKDVASPTSLMQRPGK